MAIDAVDVVRKFVDWFVPLQRAGTVDAVLLDVGGVLTVDPWEALVLSPGVGLADRLACPRLAEGALALWDKYARSRTSEADYWRELSAYAGVNIESTLISEVEIEVLRAMPWADLLLDVVDVGLGILSDNTSFWYPKQRRLLGLDSRSVGHQFLSFEHGVTKRDTPWSLYNVAEANIDPGSAVVVDDRPENIARAAELGFRTFLFRTVGYT